MDEVKKPKRVRSPEYYRKHAEAARQKYSEDPDIKREQMREYYDRTVDERRRKKREEYHRRKNGI